MTRLPLWCAICAPAFLAMSSPLYAASSDTKMPPAWMAPNLFGTVALRVIVTPYDAKWRHAGFASMDDKRRVGTPAFGELAMVQRDVNHRVSFRADSLRRDGGDSWSSAAETLARGSGDCEDYAIAKGQSLLALGFLPQDLYLVIGNSLALRSAHAILAVRVGAKFWVLDNLSSEVVDADQYRDFAPVITLGADHKWVHGYKIGAQQRLVDSRARRGLSTDRIAAVTLAQFATLRATSPAL